jgi:hypothetical protein
MISRNFQISVLVLFVACVLDMFDVVRSIDEIRAVYGRFTHRVVVAPFFIGAITAVAWIGQYRHGHGHWTALLIGLTLLVSTAGMHLSATVNELGYSRLDLVVLLYAGLSHILFSLQEWQEIFAKLGSDARGG